MPIEFRCAQCQKLLRTPDDTAGKQAKCPDCGAIVQVPAAGAAPLPVPASGSFEENPYQSPTQSGPVYSPVPPSEGARQLAVGKVTGPAIGLIVTAALGLMSLALNVVTRIGGGGAAPMPDDFPPELQKFWAMMQGENLAFWASTAVVGLIISIVVLLGAVKMMKLESYGLAVAAAILALIPCTSPCCCLGLPIGIWALVILFDAQVKAAFRT
jgi:phage FluMu protein Com